MRFAPEVVVPLLSTTAIHTSPQLKLMVGELSEEIDLPDIDVVAGSAARDWHDHDTEGPSPWR